MIDSNFLETITLLNESDVKYWVCHGTLLGLVRDGDLIPWDHDIDIAVWGDDISKKTIINLMLKNNYQLKSDGKNGGVDYDYLIFNKAGGREVDFNFYHVSRDTEMAYSEWFVPKSRSISSFFDVIINMKIRVDNPGFVIKNFNKGLSVLGCLVKPIKNHKVFFKSAGYTTPKNMLDNFKFFELPEVKVRVPGDFDAVLEFLYGEDWRTPRKNYDWEKESPSTRVSNSRFE